MFLHKKTLHLALLMERWEKTPPHFILSDSFTD